MVTPAASSTYRSNYGVGANDTKDSDDIYSGRICRDWAPFQKLATDTTGWSGDPCLLASIDSDASSESSLDRADFLSLLASEDRVQSLFSSATFLANRNWLSNPFPVSYTDKSLFIHFDLGGDTKKTIDFSKRHPHCIHIDGYSHDLSHPTRHLRRLDSPLDRTIGLLRLDANRGLLERRLPAPRSRQSRSRQSS